MVVLGKLIQQVQNGGYAQWHDNGYSEAGQLTLDALLTLGTSAGNRAYHLTKAVLHGIGATEDEDEDERDAFGAQDDAFYAIDDELLAGLERWVGANIPQEEVTA